ncbi:MAG TPA: hypothetical protein VN457_04480, partial [Chlamydiales bacterium]|nr:hypothetical protein [Chlamydiales bacterium]
MKNTVSKSLLLLALGIGMSWFTGAANGLHAVNVTTVSSEVSKAIALAKFKAKYAAIPKTHIHKIHENVLIQYTPVAVSGAGGYWQLMVLSPEGKLYKDKKHQRIDIAAPPSTSLKFRIKGHLPSGVYTIIVYVKKRTNTQAIDL